MPISQRQIVQECFDGERERSCTYCPAHHSKNGICCFGHKFEYEDPQCHSCPHVGMCEPTTMRYMEGQEYAPPISQSIQPRRIVINRPPSASAPAPSPSAPAITRNIAPVYGQYPSIRRDGSVIVPQNRTAKPLQIEDQSFWKMMGVNAAWGAVEGMLEMLLGFFRQRRPE